ncbi:Clavaminate synthase-like protein [Suillus paluster]|uniref:Clavaminate synthase-like protein n=1 Tax=Suillus paluster TaxID=48578 RepID=UPI001B87E6FF|nr:Clavaminate synthase-like protein [Suillus paluster]KAG1748926.1 Clavaminate synthase-like protein [Suillus paluster]
MSLDSFDQLLAELSDESHPCTVGNSVYFEFHAAARLLRDNADSRTMKPFIDRAYREMSFLPPSASLCWRRLYTDACLFCAISKVSDSVHVEDAAASEAIATLDRAIIIAGAPGRLESIHQLIKYIQDDHLTLKPLKAPPGHRQPLTQMYCSSAFSVGVPCIHPPPSVFGREWSQKPFVLRRYGYVQGWKALSSWASIDYLRSVAGPGRIVPVEVGKDYRAEEWTQRLMSWDSFLQSLDFPEHPAQTQNEVLYLAQHNLLMQFPALEGDIGIPEYVYACPDPPSCYPAYKPPGNTDGLVINVWLGPRGTISPAHTDPFFNCYAQAVGRKTVWLAPPEVSNMMYPFDESTSDTANKSHNPAANTTEPSMCNTSRVDVFPDSAEAEQASQDAFPAFWKEVPQKAMRVTLAPGDVLFFPPGWWHAMRSEETSFSVSMWF